MKVILANPRGFCAGVVMAIDSLDRAIELYGTPIYAYHEIVHNRPVVERFRKKGVIFVDSIDEVPEGATVLYSAHGVAPQIRAASARPKMPSVTPPRTGKKPCAISLPPRMSCLCWAAKTAQTASDWRRLRRVLANGRT